jgi:hypothetical protein
LDALIYIENKKEINMSNPVWEAIVTDFKAGVIDLETFIQKTEAWLATQITGLGGLVSQLVSEDAQTLVTDYHSDLQEIVTNIQNSTLALTFANFLPLFLTAVAPIIEQEGLKIADEDLNIIAAYFSGNAGITNVPANNGNVGK